MLSMLVLGSVKVPLINTIHVVITWDAKLFPGESARDPYDQKMANGILGRGWDPKMMAGPC